MLGPSGLRRRLGRDEDQRGDADRQRPQRPASAQAERKEPRNEPAAEAARREGDAGGERGLDGDEADEIGHDRGGFRADDRLAQGIAVHDADRPRRAGRRRLHRAGSGAAVAAMPIGDDARAPRRTSAQGQVEAARDARPTPSRHGDDPEGRQGEARAAKRADDEADADRARRGGRGRSPGGRGPRGGPARRSRASCRPSDGARAPGVAASEAAREPGRRKVLEGRAWTHRSLRRGTQGRLKRFHGRNRTTNVIRPQSPPEHPVRQARQKRWRRQVSWLAGRCPALPPSRDMSQWHLERRLAAYSCGGSRGFSPHSLFTPLPGHRPSMNTQPAGHLSTLGVEELPGLEKRPGAVQGARLF